MRGRLSTRIHIALAAFALCGSMVPVRAAEQDKIKELFGVAQQRNARLLKTYGWSGRTELLIDGKTVGVRTDKVQYDSTGRIQRTIIEAKTEPGDQGKRDQVKSVVERLSRLAQSYANLSDSQREAAMRTVKVRTDAPEVSGTVQLTAQNVVVPGDLMAIWADASTFLLQRVQIYTMFEKRSIQMNAHYEQLLGGAVVPVRVEVSYPAEKIEAHVTNAAFKLAGPATTATVSRTGTAPQPDGSVEVDPGWPRQFKNGGGTLLTFPPQVDEWKDFKEITWRMAVAITPAGLERGNRRCDHDRTNRCG